MTGLTAAGGAALASTGMTFRWHKTPRHRPFLTKAHLENLHGKSGHAPRVLFVGNSFTLMHDIPARVAQLAHQADQPIDANTAAAHGARLVETWRIPAFREALDASWDLLVLQDFSATALRAPDRWGSRYAMQAMSERAQVRRGLLFPTWAFPSGHRFYQDGAGFGAHRPDDPAMFARAITNHYNAAATQLGWVRAPVTEALAPDATPWVQEDLHHLNALGAARVAAVLWNALRPLLNE